jgi:Protein of unknown function (DUF2384)
MYFDITPEEAASLLRAAFNLFNCWQLTEQESRCLLGQPNKRDYQCWKAGQTNNLLQDTICRLKNLVGIHIALRYLFTDPERGYQWIRKPNETFAGKSALDRMLDSADELSAVRAYLKAECEG